MLTTLQKHCFNVLDKNSKDDINDSTHKKFYSDLQNLMHGDLEQISSLNDKVSKKIEILEKEQKKTPAEMKYFENLKILVKKLTQQQEENKKFDHIVGFRKTCLEFYFKIKSFDSLSSTRLLKNLKAYIFSGTESDLRKLISEVQYLQEKNPHVNKLFNEEVDKHMRQYLDECKHLSDHIQNNGRGLECFNKQIKEHCQAVLDDVTTIFDPKSKNVASNLLLVDVLSHMNQTLEQPRNEIVREASLQLAKNVSGRTIHWQRILGGFMMVIGGIATLLGIVMLPTLAGGGVIGGGIALMALGYGIFSHGAKKGLSLHMRDAVHDVHHTIVKSDFNKKIDEMMTQPVKTEEERENRNALVYHLLSLTA